MTETATKVFISYSWDSEEHKERVLSLANTLLEFCGVDADIDRYVRAKPPFTPVQGWDIWMQDRIEWAEFVLIVCTETYKRRFEGKEEPRRGLGVSWEGSIIRQSLYNEQLRDTKFIPVVFSSSDLGYVPLILNSHDKYTINDKKSYEELWYRLRKQETVTKPEIRKVDLKLPPKPTFLSSFQNKSLVEVPPIVLGVAQTEASVVVQEDIKPQEMKQRLEYRIFTAPPVTDDFCTKPEIEYSRLQELLKAGEWKEGDQETRAIVFKLCNRSQGETLEADDIRHSSHLAFLALDKIWGEHSEGRFGFSAQKIVWNELESFAGVTYKIFQRFSESVGWYGSDSWIKYENLRFDLEAPVGHFPYCRGWITPTRHTAVAQRFHALMLKVKDQQ